VCSIVSTQSTSRGLWPVALAVLLSITTLAEPTFAASSGASEPEVAPLGAQVPPGGSGPQPAPVQVPGPASAPQPAVTLPPGPWLWQQTQRADGTTVAASDPTRYNVTFLPDGRLGIQADCNRVTGTYTQQGSALTLRLGATTLAACPPGSQDQLFIRDLGAVQSFALSGSNLVLNLAANGGRMTFAAGQSSGATTPVASAKVTGTVTYRERMALPPNAVVQVSLQDTSRADAPAVVLGEQMITTGGSQVPIPFEIAYDPAVIDQRFTYSVRARITVDGQLWFTSTTATLVITRGNPSDVELVVQRV
jgi:uncharacterized lipoprotein YbaY